jgi:hypothetical protein
MVEHEKNDEMDDETLDKILGLASKPELSEGFAGRVMAMLPAEARPSAQVIAFPRRKSKAGWLMGLPLAACLVLGVWLGASGDFSDVLPVSSSTASLASADQLSPSGIDDIENLSAGDLS